MGGLVSRPHCSGKTKLLLDTHTYFIPVCVAERNRHIQKAEITHKKKNCVYMYNTYDNINRHSQKVYNLDYREQPHWLECHMMVCGYILRAKLWRPLSCNTADHDVHHMWWQNVLHTHMWDCMGSPRMFQDTLGQQRYVCHGTCMYHTHSVNPLFANMWDYV